MYGSLKWKPGFDKKLIDLLKLKTSIQWRLRTKLKFFVHVAIARTYFVMVVVVYVSRNQFAKVIVVPSRL